MSYLHRPRMRDRERDKDSRNIGGGPVTSRPLRPLVLLGLNPALARVGPIPFLKQSYLGTDFKFRNILCNGIYHSPALSHARARTHALTHNMHLILTGATGLVGSAVLDALIKNQAVTKITIISRRPVKMAEDANDSRIKVIIHKDFEKYDAELLSQIQGARGCIWALGTSQNSVSAK